MTTLEQAIETAVAKGVYNTCDATIKTGARKGEVCGGVSFNDLNVSSTHLDSRKCIFHIDEKHLIPNDMRCSKLTLRGTRCKNLAIKGEVCGTHLRPRKTDMITSIFNAMISVRRVKSLNWKNLFELCQTHNLTF